MADAAASAKGAKKLRRRRRPWHAPIPSPGKECVLRRSQLRRALSRKARGARRDDENPEARRVFTKAPTSVNGPFDDIPWECDAHPAGGLGGRAWRIIGLPASISAGGRARVMSSVHGHQRRHRPGPADAHFQFFKGKTLDGFCPMGVVVTADEFGDHKTRWSRCRVNGTVMQPSENERDVVSSGCDIEVLSRGLTLEAGDVIATGTPEGAGFGMSPPQFLKDGDIVKPQVEGIRS